MGQSNKCAEEIYSRMSGIIPFYLQDNIKPYILEAMEIYTKSRITALEEGNERLREALEKVKDKAFNYTIPETFLQIAEQALNFKSERNG